MNRPAAARLGAYALVVAAGTAGLWRVETTAHRAQDTADALAQDQVLDEAQRCIAAWTTREEFRDATEKGARIGSDVATESLAQLAEELGGTDQAVIDRYNEIKSELIEPGVAAARAEIEDPDCDLDRARHVVAG